MGVGNTGWPLSLGYKLGANEGSQPLLIKDVVWAKRGVV